MAGSTGRVAVIIGAGRIVSPIKVDMLRPDCSIGVLVVGVGPVLQGPGKLQLAKELNVAHWAPASNVEFDGPAAIQAGSYVKWPVSSMLFTSFDGEAAQDVAKRWGEHDSYTCADAHAYSNSAWLCAAPHTLVDDAVVMRDSCECWDWLGCWE